jgi:hypothetical protein
VSGVESAPRFSDAAAWFGAGNVDERYTTLAMESMLAELASAGRSPLALYTESPPFSTSPGRVDTRDRLERCFEHYTDSAIPAIRLSALEEMLSDGRQRARLRARGPTFGAVLIRGSTIPEDGLPVIADGVVLFITKGTATPAWVYKAARILTEHAKDLPICIVVVNCANLEEAAVFFQEMKDEVLSLLRKDIMFRFAGFLKFDSDYTSAALNVKKPIVRYFPGSPFHGQVKYVLKALSRAVSNPPAESFLERMAARAESRR